MRCASAVEAAHGRARGRRRHSASRRSPGCGRAAAPRRAHDRVGAEPELRGDASSVPLSSHRRRRARPPEPLLFRGRAGRCVAQRRPRSSGDRLARGDEDQPGRSLDEARDAVRAASVIAALDEQRAASSSAASRSHSAASASARAAFAGMSAAREHVESEPAARGDPRARLRACRGHRRRRSCTTVRRPAAIERRRRSPRPRGAAPRPSAPLADAGAAAVAGADPGSSRRRGSAARARRSAGALLTSARIVADLEQAPAPQRPHGVSALQCGSGSTASASAKVAQARCPAPRRWRTARRAPRPSPRRRTAAARRARTRSGPNRSASTSIAAGAGSAARAACELRSAPRWSSSPRSRAFSRANSATSTRWFASVQSSVVPARSLDLDPLIQEARRRRRRIDDRAVDAVDAQAREVIAERRVRDTKLRLATGAVNGCGANSPAPSTRRTVWPGAHLGREVQRETSRCRRRRVDGQRQVVDRAARRVSASWFVTRAASASAGRSTRARDAVDAGREVRGARDGIANCEFRARCRRSARQASPRSRSGRW